MKTIGLISLCLFLSLAVYANDEDTVKIRQVALKEVLVQSFKQNRDLRLEPVSATITSGTAIQNRNIINIKELSSFIPNLFMPEYGSKQTSPVFIRGIGSKINAPSVGLYVDGVPYFEKSAFDFDFTEIEKMEVLRGPQGTLYGRNTMGGIINVYTKSPLKYQGTNASFSGGNYGYRAYSLSRYQTVGEKFGYAISGNYNRNDGYFMNETLGKKTDPLKSGSARIRLEWKPRNELTFGLISSFDYLDQGGYPYALCDSITHKPGVINYNDYSFYKRTMSTTGLSVEYQGKGYSIRNQMAFQYVSDRLGIDQDFSPVSIYFAKQNQKQKMFSEEFTIKSTSSNNYKWLFGAFAFTQQIDNTVLLDFLKAGYNTDKRYDTPTSGVALYHQSTLDNLLVSGLSLTFGLRYDYEYISSDYVYFKNTKEKNTLVEDSYSNLKFSQLNPKVALQYLFPSTGMLYATVTKGYKTGGFNTSFEREEDRSFRPENSWNYELGAKHPFLDNRLNAEVCLFYIDWKNQQIYQTPPSGRGSMLKNAGRSTSKGVEVSLQGNPVNGLMVHVNYGYTHATFKDYRDDSKKINYNGKKLPLVPSHTFSAGIDYTISNPLRFIDRCVFSVNGTGSGQIYWKEDNKVSQPFYGLLNAKVAVTRKFATFAVWAKNITSTDYTAYYFESGKDGKAQPGRPFTIGANIQLNF